MGFRVESLKAKTEKRQEELASKVPTSNVFVKAGVAVQPPSEVEGGVEVTDTVNMQVTDEAPVITATEAIPQTPVNEQQVEVQQHQEEQSQEVTEGTIIEETPVVNPVTQITNAEEVHEVRVQQETFSEATITAEPSLSDANVFKQLTANHNNTGNEGNDSYAELIENMVSQQCQMSGVKNLDLTTFGLRAQVLTFPNLTVMSYGIHKFLGAPFTEEEENSIIHRLGLYVAQSNKDRIVVKAVQEIEGSRGMTFYSLQFDERIAQRFANMFNYTVHANINESDVSKLVLVIQK